MNEVHCLFGPVSDAAVSECGTYRYTLTRVWDEGMPNVCFCMLNPSIADAFCDDPTIRKILRFARSWGYGSLLVVNLFAYRSTSPAALRKVAANRIGPENDRYIAAAVAHSKIVVVAWGYDGELGNRDRSVMTDLKAIGKPIFCLGRTSAGFPKHPLYISGRTPLEPYRGRDQ